MATIDLTVFAGRGLYTTREEIAQIEEAGANRVILWLKQNDLATTLNQLEDYARDLLG
jgi:hypothetical protein